MSTRIVLLGWAGEAIEVDSSEAGAFVDSGMCRASMSKWGGPLADATVLMFRAEYLLAHGGEGEAGQTQAMKVARKLAPGARTFILEGPIPVGA